MRKAVALLVSLAFLTASCVVMVKPVFSSTEAAEDTWVSKAPMHKARAGLGVAVVDGKIYAIGGLVGNGVVTGVNEVYDPETDSWITKTPMPTAAFGHISTVVDDKIYVIDSNLNQIYDVKTDTWSLGASPPLDVGYGGAGATVGVNAPKRIYVLTEKVWGESRFNQIYDPANDSWMFGAAVPTSRLDFNVAVVNDKLYAIGGFKLSYAELYSIDVVVTPYATNEVYTPFGYGAVPPAVSVVSPENTTYETSNVSLAFTVNKPVNWTGYSLDGGETVTIGGNTTLSGLPNGVNNVTVYAKDAFGNTGASETVSFTVDVPEPFPTVPVAVSGISIVVVVGGVLAFYFRKRNEKR
jgi:hypothetical protein